MASADLTTTTVKEMTEAVRSGDDVKFLRISNRTTAGRERVELGNMIFQLCDKEDDNPLYHVARHKNAELCEVLCEDYKLDANFVYPSGKMPLSFAAYFGDSLVIGVLIKHGADLFVQDNNGFTPMHYAVIGDNPRAIEVLLTKGAQVDVQNFTGSPLLLASLLGHISCVKVLLDQNANPNELLCGVVTPLLVAVMNNNNCSFHPQDETKEIVELLIKAGADVNKIPVLSLAYHSKELMEYLLDSGADPNLPNECGRFPIEVAAMRGKREIVEMLFPITSPISSVQDWSVDGLITKFTSEKFASKERLVDLKQKIKDMLFQKEYLAALVLCNYAIEEDPENARVYYAKRSFCWKHLGNAVHERYFTNATTDADLIGMRGVIRMLGKDHLLELLPFCDYIGMLD